MIMFNLKQYILIDNKTKCENGYNYQKIVKDFISIKQYAKKDDLLNDIIKFGNGHLNINKIKSAVQTIGIK